MTVNARFLLTRRAALAGAATLAALPPLRLAHAAEEGIVVIGENGWLFPSWDKLRGADLTTIDQCVGMFGGVAKQFKAAGINLSIALMPMKARIYPQFLPPDDPLTPVAQSRYGHCLNGLTGQGIQTSDLATLFTSLSTQPAPALPSSGDPTFVPVGSDVFFKADTHWATPGSLPAADQIARDAMAAFSLAPSSTPGSQLGAIQIQGQEQNDLAQLLPPDQQAKYPLESYPLPQSANSGGDDTLIASDAADVVVIGNSYMQPKYGFTAELSNKLNRPVSLFWKIDRYGPFATMTEYLKSDLYKQQRPKLIVWTVRETHLEHTPDDDDFYGSNAMAPADLTAAVQAALA